MCRNVFCLVWRRGNGQNCKNSSCGGTWMPFSQDSIRLLALKTRCWHAKQSWSQHVHIWCFSEILNCEMTERVAYVTPLGNSKGGFLKTFKCCIFYKMNQSPTTDSITKTNSQSTICDVFVTCKSQLNDRWAGPVTVLKFGCVCYAHSCHWSNTARCRVQPASSLKHLARVIHPKCVVSTHSELLQLSITPAST